MHITMTPPNKSRSRRLRKKLHVGEFKELGIEFTADLKGALSPEAEDRLIDAFLVEIIEPRNLALGGSVTGGFIARFGRGSVSEEDRTAIELWLRARPEYQSVQVSPLMDAWHEAP